MRPPFPTLKLSNRYTLAGLLAILIWSSTIAFSRSLSEVLGPLTSGAVISTLGGLVSLAFAAATPGGLRRFARMPLRYYLACGPLFILYMLLLYLAVGQARDRAQVLAVGLANYLWPCLVILFSIPLLGNRPNLLLVPGILLTLGGTWLAALGSDPRALSGLDFSARGLLPVGMAAAAAVLWAVYSNLVNRLAPPEGNAVPVFLFLSGLAFWLLRWLMKEQSAWDAALLPNIAYMAVFPAWLAYTFWDNAMKKGDLVITAAFSFFSPLLSTLFSLFILRLPLTLDMALAAGLVCAGAVLSRLGIRARQA